MPKTYKIKKPTKERNIDKDKVENGIDYPVFCFKHLHINSMKKGNAEILKEFVIRLQNFCDIGWIGINNDNRHKFGYEMLDKNIFKPDLPDFITPEVKKLHVFRATGSNLPFVAYKNGNILHVLFIEVKFGDIYDHE